MFEICSGRKIISGSRLWPESNSKMGVEAKADQYGEGSEESEGRSPLNPPKGDFGKLIKLACYKVFESKLVIRELKS